MKMKKVLILLSIIFLTLLFNSATLLCLFSESAGGGGGACCSASALLDGSCAAYCPVGQCCHCEAGLFTATCECYECNNTPTIIRSLPKLTPKQRQDAVEFSEWCQNQTPGIQGLKPIVLNILSAIDSNDQQAYNNYEKQFRDTFVGLTPSEQDACNQWAIQRGY